MAKQQVMWCYLIFTWFLEFFGNMSVLSKNGCMENHMKLAFNASTWNFLNHSQSINVSKIKVGMANGHLMLYNLFCIYLASYVCNLWTCLLMHLCESKKSFIIFSTLILYLKLYEHPFLAALAFWVCRMSHYAINFWISLFVVSPSMDACYKIFWLFGRKTFSRA